MPLPVSIIIPAYNAALTLAETLASVQAQTHREWEAIVVENGSTDSTPILAAQFAEHDPRIRMVRSPLKGVSRARNLGLQLAGHEWILFLDADDTIEPRHLEALTATLAADPALDAVHCGWRRVSPEGAVMFEEFGPDKPDLFPQLARTCLFAIHACIVRRSLVLGVGGFDQELRTCEDWDLWLRIARAGARFKLHRELLVSYRARPQSASMDGRQMLADSFVVIARAHAPDPRVPDPLDRYAQGMPVAGEAAARLENLIWHAGLLLGSGLEAATLLEALGPDSAARINAETAAATLFAAALLPTARAPDAWCRLQVWILPQLERFLNALEARTHQRGLTRSVLTQLERRAVSPRTVSLPLTVGRTQAIALELTSPFPDLSFPAPVERLHCRLLVEGVFLGELELPVFDGHVDADVLADAVAAEYAWPVLGRFFARNLYPQLEIERDIQGWIMRRDGVELARDLPGASAISWDDAHDRIGWSLFLQEAWALETVPDGRFYTLDRAERRREPSCPRRGDTTWIVLDLLDPLKDRRLDQPHVDLVLTVAGVPVARSPLIVPKRILSEHTLRAALTIETGFELCRACVREALLQQPFGNGDTLRGRLAEARARRTRALAAPGLALPDGFMPGAATLFPRSGRPHAETVLWPRHPGAPCGTSVSRRASLPQSVLPELKRWAAAGHEALISCLSLKGSGRTIRYAPELVWRSPGVQPRPHATPPPASPAALVDAAAAPRPAGSAVTDQHHPHHRTLQLLPARRFRTALEIVCDDGHLTAQLAPRVGRLLATDTSRAALELTRQRCESHANVEVHELDPVYDPLPRDRFDLIVYRNPPDYAGSRAALEVVAEKLTTALEPGGYFVCVHTPKPRPSIEGAESHDALMDADLASSIFRAAQSLQLLHEVRAPSCRIQLYQRSSRWSRWLSRPATRIQWSTAPAAPPRPATASSPHRSCSPLPPVHPTETTARLPILMYHRVATDGPAELARYRVSPQEFEAQLRSLKDHGYSTTTLEEWRTVREVKRPLPGKRVLLTFDDGCADFLDTAWPLLERYGFKATMFLPTDLIGDACRWDAHLGEPARVMSWADLRGLHQAGVEFGSHTATHPLLTGLSPDEMAREALRSRTAIAEELGLSVTSIAYPFGASDRVVESTFGAAGYLFGLTCEHRSCEVNDRLLALPRIEVSGGLGLKEFGELLGL